MLPDEFPVPPHVVTVAWRAVEGDLLLPVEDADWLGASLGILLAAVHHPEILASQQPGTDAREVAAEVLEELPELQLAAHTADQQPPLAEEPAARPRVELQRDGAYLRVSPGAELASLCLNLEVFAKAVLDPAGDDAQRARGAIAYSASAWSRGLGLATGAVAETGARTTARTVDHPGAAPDPPPVSL